MHGAQVGGEAGEAEGARFGEGGEGGGDALESGTVGGEGEVGDAFVDELRGLVVLLGGRWGGTHGAGFFV